MLIANQDLVNIIRVSRLARYCVVYHLKDVLKAGSVVEIDVGYTVVTIHEKAQL
jgi:hypothetical protein